MIDFAPFFENPHITLYDLQKKAISEAILKRYFLVIGEQGAGKTEIGIYISKIILSLNSVKSVLIVTRREILDKFKTKLLMHIPDLSESDIKVMDSNEERNLFDFNAKIYICDYNQIKLVHYFYAGGKKGRITKALPIDENWAVIFDEIQAVKTPKSDVHKICFANTKTAKYRIGLSGTPIEKIEDLYAIFRVLDEKIININYYFFMETIAHVDPLSHRLLYYKKNGVEKIRNKINPYLMIFKKDQIKEVVDKHITDVTAEFTPSFLRKYKEEIHNLTFTISEFGYITKKNIASIIQPLYNCIKEVDENNPRFIKFLKLINRFIGTEKVVVWERSPEIIVSLSEYFTKLGVENLCIYGAIQKDTRADIIKQFNENKNIKILFVSFLTSAEAWEIPSRKDCKRMIFYSLPDRIISYQQCIDRLHRLTSEEPVFIYRMILNNSIDDWASWLLDYKQKMRDDAIDKQVYTNIEVESLKRHLGETKNVLGDL